MTRWSAITRTRGRRSALAYGSRSTTAAEEPQPGRTPPAGTLLEVALEQSGRFVTALAFGDPPLDVGLRRSVGLTSLQDDRVQGAVELAVAAAAEAMPDRLAAGGGHGCDGGEAGEGGFGEE